jgi:hypothetical protein
MGDSGFLVNHRCEIRRHNPIGDILTIEATVTGITADDQGRPCAEVKQVARNQGGELSARGTGLVRLPPRA